MYEKDIWFELKEGTKIPLYLYRFRYGGKIIVVDEVEYWVEKIYYNEDGSLKDVHFKSTSSVWGITLSRIINHEFIHNDLLFGKENSEELFNLFKSKLLENFKEEITDEEYKIRKHQENLEWLMATKHALEVEGWKN